MLVKGEVFENTPTVSSSRQGDFCLYWMDPGCFERTWRGEGGGRRKVQLARVPVGEATEICLQSIGNLMRLLFNLNSCTEERFPLQANAEAVEQLQD